MNRPGRGTLVWLLAGATIASFATLGVGAAAAAIPANTAVPTITGAPTESATLTASTGTWTGAPTSYAYQWIQCDSAGLTCIDIPGATGQTHVVTADDVDDTLEVRVVATNSSGQASAVSAPTVMIIGDEGPEPEDTALPVVTGTPAAGSTLTTSNGTWSGTPAPTFTYEWQRCDSSGNNCLTIPSQTSSSYTVAAADVGSTIQSVVTATNSSGSTYGASAVTAVVTASAGGGGGTGGGGTSNGPKASTLPSLTGNAQVGSTLTLATGSWTGTGTISYAYAWQRCNSFGSGCTPIAGATGKTYVVKAADNGSSLKGTVTATDASGTTTEATSPTTVVGGTTVGVGSGAAGAPAPVVAPLIDGVTEVGAALTTDQGGWESTTGLALSTAWLRCNAKGGACVSIAGARGLTYTLTAADGGHTLRSSITATNPQGANVAMSALTAVIGKTRAIHLAGGGYSLTAATVTAPDKLVVASVRFTPTRLTSRAPFTARVRVADLHGAFVSGALVRVRGATPGIVRPVAAVRTGASGWATIRLTPTAKLALHGGSLALLVTASRTGSGAAKVTATKRVLVTVR